MTRVFVYGTLLAGEPNHRLLESVLFIGVAETAPVFSLVDLGAFPALVAGGADAVTGEVYEVDHATLARLDVLEGHPRFYRRQHVALDSGGQVETYVLSLEQVAGRPIIKSGSWRTRQGVES